MVKRILICLSLSCSALSAADTSPADSTMPGNPPAVESIKQLLEVTQVHKLLDTVTAQMEGVMKEATQQVTKGHPITPNVQNDIDKGHAEAMAMVKEILDWDKLEPMYVRVYQRSFTQ